jgi:hypothetical protein
MKYCFSMLITVSLLNAVSCTKDHPTHSFAVNVKIASELTQQNIANANVHVKVASEKVSGSYVYDVLTDSFMIRSGANGNFSCNIKYNDDPNIFITFEKTDDAYSTGFIPQKTAFALSELNNTSQLTFYVRRYASLIINVKNLHPFDANDAIGVDIVQNGTNYTNNGIESIQNFGVSNQPLIYPAADDGTNTYWTGKNVNSTIYAKVQEGTTYQLTWNVRKNGINTAYKSDKFTTSLNGLNSYDIFY